MKKETYKIRIAGFGGQGVLFLGKLIAEVANKKGYNITWLPSYGPEMRGGTANCSVIISKKEIPTPVIDEIDILVAFNQPSLEKFEDQVQKNGLIVIDSGLVKSNIRNIVEIDATKRAEKLGSVKIANMVVAGFLLKELNLFDKNIVQDVLKELGLNKEIIELNLKALEVAI